MGLDGITVRDQDGERPLAQYIKEKESEVISAMVREEVAAAKKAVGGRHFTVRPRGAAEQLRHHPSGPVQVTRYIINQQGQGGTTMAENEAQIITIRVELVLKVQADGSLAVAGQGPVPVYKEQPKPPLLMPPPPRAEVPEAPKKRLLFRIAESHPCNLLRREGGCKAEGPYRIESIGKRHFNLYACEKHAKSFARTYKLPWPPPYSKE